MQATGNKISLITRIISGSFSEHLSGAYDLFVFIGTGEISCAVAEKKNNIFIALESWECDEEIPAAEFLESAFSESEILKIHNYGRVICCTGFRNGSIVPDVLFTPETAKDQLNFSSTIQQDEEIIVDEIQQVQAKIIYSIPGDVSRILTSHFRNAELHHIATAMTGYLVTNRRNSMESMVNVNIHKSFFEVYITKRNQLFLYNTFTFQSAEEFVYYILFVCEQLHLNPETIGLQFSGKVMPEDELYILAGKYFRNVSLVSRPDNYTYDFGFNKLPSHFHFNLFSELVCAS